MTGSQKRLCAPLPWTVVKEDADFLRFKDAKGNFTTIMADCQHDPSVGIFGDPDGAAMEMEFIKEAVNNYGKLAALARDLIDDTDYKNSCVSQDYGLKNVMNLRARARKIIDDIENKGGGNGE